MIDARANLPASTISVEATSPSRNLADSVKELARPVETAMCGRVI